MSKPVRRRERSAPSRALVPCPPTEHARVRNSLRHCDVPIGELKDPSRNVRRYNKRQTEALKASITRFGIVRPVLITSDRTIVAGVGIWLAARELGVETIPVVYVEHLSPEEIRLYRIADNKLSTLGDYDEDALRLEFLELSDLSLNLDLKLALELTGFTTKEIDDRTLPIPKDANDSDGVEEGEGEGSPLPIPATPVTRPGDIWVIDGEHKIICGDSLNEATYAALMGDELAQMVVADGPYGVRIKGNVSSRKDAREFAYASGEMSHAEFVTFERSVMGHLNTFSIDGSIHYHFISWHFLCELLTAGRAEYSELKNLLVWVKTNGSRGFYRSQHELIAVFKRGKAPHICTFGIEAGARWRTNVIVQAGCNSFGPTRDEDLGDHVTVKPVSLIADLMRDCSRLGGLILDPFGGSGATILAAHWSGRRARLIEIDPAYVDVTILRAAKRFGLETVLASTGQPFAEVALERLGADAVAGFDWDGDSANDPDEEDEADFEELEAFDD